MPMNLKLFSHFSMTYVFMDDEDIVYEYEQTDPAPLVAADGNSVRFVLTNIDQNEDSEHYSFVLFKEDDGDYSVKSDYFDDADEFYPLAYELSEQDVKFILEGGDEVMYLYGFFD